MTQNQLRQEQSSKQVKSEAAHKQLLALGTTGDSPWSPVQFVKGVEILGAFPGTLVRIVVRDPERRNPEFKYLHKGSGMKILNFPRGEMQVQRVKGKEPLTITAYCGP